MNLIEATFRRIESHLFSNLQIIDKKGKNRTQKPSMSCSRRIIDSLSSGCWRARGRWELGHTTATAPGISDTKQPRDQRPTPPPPPPPPSQFFKSDHMLLVMLEGHEAAVRFLMLAAADARPRKSLALVSPAERHSWAGRQWALSPGARGTAGLTCVWPHTHTHLLRYSLHNVQHFRGLLVILTLSVTDFSDSTFAAFLLL